VEILQDIARIASAAHVPFLSAAAPSLMKIDTWQDISVPRDISRVYSTADYASWRALRESEESRYLTLTMPRFLARLPYGEQTRPVEGFAFEEALQGSETRSFVWANSAYALGANIARAFAAYRWCALFQGPESGGVVEGLATHEFPSEDGGIYTSPTEIRISDRWEAELARNGLTPLVASKNAGSAVFFSAQSIQKPPEYDDPDITAAAVLAARLPYVLTCCRFVQYLKCIARSSVGSFRSREDMERSLNDWIAQYIDHDPASSSEEAKARRPLADAQIVVESIEGNPASHRGKIYLRPQYQLKSLPGSLRFATMLP
jgi:type VI secretion system protein ImpC